MFWIRGTRCLIIPLVYFSCTVFIQIFPPRSWCLIVVPAVDHVFDRSLRQGWCLDSLFPQWCQIAIDALWVERRVFQCSQSSPSLHCHWIRLLLRKCSGQFVHGLDSCRQSSGGNILRFPTATMEPVIRPLCLGLRISHFYFFQTQVYSFNNSL